MDDKLITREDINTFIFHRKWIENVSPLPPDTQARIICDISRMALGLEPLFPDDPVVQAMKLSATDGVDHSVNAYLDKLNMGKKAGRKKKYDDREIYALSQQGMTVSEIAKKLQCSESTVRHSDGYKNRKIANFEF